MSDERFREQALEHLDALHNLAVYLTRNGSEAQDLVQETYVRAMICSSSFECAFSTGCARRAGRADQRAAGPTRSRQ